MSYCVSGCWSDLVFWVWTWDAVDARLRTLFLLQIAIALTAIVHLFNNLLKVGLLGRYADRQVVLHFGVPAIFAAFIGAWVLDHLVGLSPWIQYRLFEHVYQIMPVKVAIAILLVVFTLLELIMKEDTLLFDRRYLAVGGIMSGFFGGLSGHQGALRSTFLIKCRLSKHGFLGSGVVIACLVDLTRIAVYGATFSSLAGIDHLVFLLAVVASAFSGTWLWNQLLHTAPMQIIRMFVAIMVCGIAAGLGAGLI